MHAQSQRIQSLSAFSSRGVFPVVFYEGSLTAEDYCKVPVEGLPGTADILHPDVYWFIRDHAPCHTAAYTTSWLQEHHVQMLLSLWLAQIST